MKILCTGGAGYIGSVVVEELLKYGQDVIVLDNLQQGHKDAVPNEVQFIQGDLRDFQTLDGVFKTNKIDAVIHLAGEAVISKSMTAPDMSFGNNVVGGINLLSAMLNNGCNKIIYSSTAAVYGNALRETIDEDCETIPCNPYGESKLMFEKILEWYRVAYDLQYVTFRYFAAAGAGDKVGEDHRPETHLIPNVLRAALKNEPVNIYGINYPSPDGTCIRDFVHVKDISRAHLLALEDMELFEGTYNLGSNCGYSVYDVINMAEIVTGKQIKTIPSPMRPGDPVRLVAICTKAKELLKWQPQYDLKQIISDAWTWMLNNPDGYKV